MILLSACLQDFSFFLCSLNCVAEQVLGDTDRRPPALPTECGVSGDGISAPLHCLDRSTCSSAENIPLLMLHFIYCPVSSFFRLGQLRASWKVYCMKHSSLTWMAKVTASGFLFSLHQHLSLQRWLRLFFRAALCRAMKYPTPRGNYSISQDDSGSSLWYLSLASMFLSPLPFS